MSRPRGLFLCTHNSARREMAEGFLRAMAGDRFEAESAGAAEERLAVFRRVRDQIQDRLTDRLRGL